MSGAVINAIPGILVQIILIPILVMILKKYTATANAIPKVSLGSHSGV